MQARVDPRDFAVHAHADQTYGGQPYVAHLDAVANLVGEDADLRAVAYLHDVVEDTPVTTDDVVRTFGPTIGAAVAMVTDPPGDSRRIRKDALHDRLAEADAREDAVRLALHVKVADRLANVRRCVADDDPRLAMYRREHQAFRPAAHRPGLCDALWSELDDLLA
ncbi:MAG: HD domain-containing protein [Myxococcota bacterium]